MANLLKPVIIQDPYLVFCLHTERDDAPIQADSLESVELPLNTTISLFRNTLIFPILLWEWYGFPQWIDIDEFLEKFGGKVNCNNRNEKLSYINQMISENAIIGTNHVLLKDEEMANLNARLEKIGESVNNSRREIISGTTYRVILEPLDLLVDDLLDLALLVLAELAAELLLVSDLVLQTVGVALQLVPCLHLALERGILTRESLLVRRHSYYFK